MFLFFYTLDSRFNKFFYHTQSRQTLSGELECKFSRALQKITKLYKKYIRHFVCFVQFTRTGHSLWLRHVYKSKGWCVKTYSYLDLLTATL